MASNYYGFDFYKAIKNMSKIIKHIHLADAKGIDQEGVTMGEGDLDVGKLGVLIDRMLPDIPIVSETWQGHLEEGRNFVKDLNFYYEKKLQHLNKKSSPQKKNCD